MHAGAGLSQVPRSLDAVACAADDALSRLGGRPADLVFLFCSAHHGEAIDAVLKEAVELAGTESVVGCTGVGVLSESGEAERGPGVAFLALAGDSLQAIPFLGQGEDALDEIAEMIIPHTTERSTLVLMPDPFHFQPSELISGLESKMGAIPIVGGAASGGGMDQKTLQWCGRQVASDGVAGVLLGGDIQTMTGVAQGCQPFGQAYTITKAQGNVIQEIAFSPAIEALKEAVATLSSDDREAAGPSIFVGLAMDEAAIERGRGDFLVRNLVGVDEKTGAIAVAERVEVGQTIQFNLRTAGAAHQDIEAVVNRLAGQTRPEFGLYFNCLGRGQGLFGRPDHDVSVIRECLGSFPLAGFFGNAEFAPIAGKNFVHNYTGALVLFSGEESKDPIQDHGTG